MNCRTFAPGRILIVHLLSLGVIGAVFLALFVLDGIRSDSFSRDLLGLGLGFLAPAILALLFSLKKVSVDPQRAELRLGLALIPLVGRKPWPLDARTQVELHAWSPFVFWDFWELTVNTEGGSRERIGIFGSREKAFALAESLVRAGATRIERGTGVSADHSDLPAVQRVLIACGLPVPVRMPGAPWKYKATHVVVAMTAIISLWMLYLRPELIERFGFLPAQPTRYYGVTWLTPFLIHASWVHLLGNLYFLFIFGYRVEADLRPLRFACLLAGATVAGNLLEFALGGSPDLVRIGASDGVFAILVYHLVRFPKSRFLLSLFQRRMQISGLWLLGYFAFFQLLGLLATGFRTQSVAYWAHIGGGLLGWAAAKWRATRRNDAPLVIGDKG